jgi:hypothetical protein
MMTIYEVSGSRVDSSAIVKMATAAQSIAMPRLKISVSIIFLMTISRYIATLLTGLALRSHMNVASSPAQSLSWDKCSAWSHSDVPARMSKNFPSYGNSVPAITKKISVCAAEIVLMKTQVQ